MLNENPIFSIRSLGNAPEYVVDAIWFDGTTEALSRVFASIENAAKWVNEYGSSWVRDHHRLKSQ